MAANSLLIVNRKSAARPDLRAAVKAAQKEHSLDVRVPWSNKQLRKDILRAVRKGTRRVIAGGGDGTINNVAAALLRLDLAGEVEFGFVPLGTANDFARGCGDLGDDLAASLTRALTGDALPTDLGEINGQPFVNVASGGFGAMVTATTPREMKAQLGGLAYTLHGLSRLGDMRPHTCRFTLDGTEEIDASISFMAVGNSRYAGGAFDVAPEAVLDDGLLDLAFLSQDWERSPGFIVREILDPTNPENQTLVYRRFSTCRMEADRPFHLNLDGEPVEAEAFDIRVLPAAIRMVR